MRLELTYLVRGEDDSVHTPLRDRLVPWSKDALGTDVLQLGSANCQTVSFSSLQASKSSPRQDPLDAAKDQADLSVLLKIGMQPESLGPGPSS